MVVRKERETHTQIEREREREGEIEDKTLSSKACPHDPLPPTRRSSSVSILL
jgi:hypothetical protein